MIRRPETKNALCFKSRGREIPVVPPQFTANAASWAGSGPNAVTGAPVAAYHGLARRHRSERYSAGVSALPCTGRQFSEQRDGAYLFSSSRSFLMHYFINFTR